MKYENGNAAWPLLPCILLDLLVKVGLASSSFNAGFLSFGKLVNMAVHGVLDGRNDQ